MLPEHIAASMGEPLEEVEKALVQMRMPRPETTRGTLNITLAAHSVVLKERKGDEPLWQTFDRIVDELLRLRSIEGGGASLKVGSHGGSHRKPHSRGGDPSTQPGFSF